MHRGRVYVFQYHWAIFRMDIGFLIVSILCPSEVLVEARSLGLTDNGSHQERGGLLY